MALSFPSVSLVDVETVGAGILGLLGAVWALKRALGFFNGGEKTWYDGPPNPDDRGDWPQDERDWH